MWTLMDGGPIQGHTVVSGGSWLPLDMYPPPSLALFLLCQMCSLLWAATANYHRIGGLKKTQIRDLTVLARTEIKVPVGSAFSRGSGGESFPSSSSFWGVLVLLGLWCLPMS